MNNIKGRIIDEIRNSVNTFYKVSDVQYRIRCPLCGDSQKNSKEAHLYLKCSYDANEPILYHCFKCNSSGKVNQGFLNKLNITITGLSDIENKIFHKISNRIKPTTDIMSGAPNISSQQCKYIQSRLGEGFTIDDYDKFKIVWDLSLIVPFITDIRTKNTLPNNRESISFLSSDNSSLLTRFFEESDSRWRKSKIFPSENRSIYTIKTIVDLFNSDILTVNIAEGVFDVISIYKNFSSNNSVHIATLGSDYENGIDYAIENGMIGNNIIIKIYLDEDIDEKRLRYKLKKYRWLFKEIYLYKNLKYKDVGTTIDNIRLVEYRV